MSRELAGFRELRRTKASHEFRESTRIISGTLSLYSWLDLFGFLLTGCSECAAGLAAVVNCAFHLVATRVNFSRVVNRGPGCVEVDGDLVSLYHAFNGSLA